MGAPCRLARPSEVEAIREIQRAAAGRYATLPYTQLATYEPDTVETLAHAQDNWWLWVAVDDADQPIGAARVLPLAGALHLRQVDVHPDHAGRRIGAALIGAVERFFGRRGIERLTLTAFVDLPWNAPYFARLGFRIVLPADMTAELERAWTEEAGSFPRERRVVMQRKFKMGD